MKSRFSFLKSILIIVLFASTALFSASNAKLAPKFSSSYTNLNTQCKNAFKSVGEGQDMPLKCKGFGGYYIYVYYSAWASHITVNKSEEDSISLTSQSLNYTDEKGRKIEWRMADGKPFAVILRVSNYKERDDGDNPFDEKNKIGESLLIKGLKGYEKIDYEVSVKSTANPNVKARELADKGYLDSK